jgi:hypothetical protein
MTWDSARQRGIEADLLKPFLLSPRYLEGPVVAEGSVRHALFACPHSLDLLSEKYPGGLRYIRSAMKAVVPVRGKGLAVSGYHRSPRLARANRKPWYNLKSTLDRRGAYPILTPRRFFTRCVVAMNSVDAVANEDFIEVSPTDGRWTKPLLAYLNSSFGEFILRCQAFQYGGGVYDMSPAAMQGLPVPDLGDLDDSSLHSLAQAWEAFVAAFSDDGRRAELDLVIGDIFGLSEKLMSDTHAALADLAQLSVTATRRGHG